MHRRVAGTASIEFGLLIPVLVTLLLCCAEIGFFIQQTMLVNRAVEAGVSVAKMRGFDTGAIISAILTNERIPNLRVTPPSLYCGCIVNRTVKPVACDAKCAGNLIPGHYTDIGAQLKAQTILPGGFLPLPDSIVVQATTRLN